MTRPPATGGRSRLPLLTALAVLAAALPAPAGAQPPPLIFADGFESTLCTWTNGHRFLRVTPDESALGAEIVIEGCGIDARAPEVFLSRGEGPVSLAVVDFAPGRVVARLDAPAPSGVYDLAVRQGSSLLRAPGGFTVQLPTDLAFDPSFVGEGTEVTMTARFLGPDQGQITMRSQSVPGAGSFAVQILSWDDGAGVTQPCNPIALDNPSFENDVLADGAFTSSIASWTHVGGGTGLTHGAFNPTTSQFPAGVPDGVNSAYVQSGAIDQVVAAETLVDDALYVLDVEVGQRADRTLVNWAAQLVVAGTVRASVDQSAGLPLPGSFASFQTSFGTGPADAGKPLTIRLSGPAPQAGFDDVRLCRVDSPVQDPSVGTVVFVVPRDLPSNGLYDVTVTNPVGSVTDRSALTVVGLATNDQEGPRVVSAGAASNTEVLVQLSEPVQGGPDGAENPAHFRITAPGARIPTLDVLAADLLAPANSTVLLTTRSQSDITYTVKVTNVRDLAGNPLAPPTILVDPSVATFVGIPPGGAENVDTDGDGLTDMEEQRGWTVTVTKVNGDTVSTTVTSDATDPDTDGDTVLDAGEKQYGTNPRGADTDTDELTDHQELNETYSDPAHQDSDGDGYVDGLEFNFFHTSPTLADTDGDQLTDDEEILLGNRNPRVADLPSPTIEVGEINLQLDVRFVESTSVETRELDAKSVSSTLEQSESKEISNTHSTTQEASVKLSKETEHEVTAGFTDSGTTHKVTTGVEAGWTGSWTGEWSRSSSTETQEAYEESRSTEVEGTEGASVERQVEGASMQATVSLKVTTNLAYRIQNLQLTALIQNPQDPTSLTPVATLLPDSEPEEGFTLGPLAPERGPLIFSNDTIFPNLVEDLMRNPRGLVFEISNFDIVDELGRNFAFTSQEIVDRTATLVIDNGTFDADGDGEGDLTEYHRVATGSGRLIDTDGDDDVDGDDRRVVFDSEGRHVGVTLADALDALGLSRLDEDTTPTSSLSDVELESSYSTRSNGDVEIIYRVRRTARDGIHPKAWEIITPTGIDYSLGVDDHILETESDLKLAFVQDLDEDRFTQVLERMNNCTDLLVDTDDDGLDDRFEVLIGWTVETGSGTRQVYSSCSLEDTDGDGLTDDEEAPASFTFEDIDGVPGPDTPALIAEATSAGTGDVITDPASSDTDGDGVEDFEEVNGYCVTLRDSLDPNDPECTGGPAAGQIFVTTNPNDPDTDGDTASDGVERTFGGDPTTADLNNFADDDGDGLVNVVETDGWAVAVEAVSASPGTCDTICDPGASFVSFKFSDPLVADTDFDGLLDGEERDLGTDPSSADTDGDGLSDFEEVRGIQVRDLGVLVLDPLDADTDDDKRSDGDEAELEDVEADRWIVRVVDQTPYRVWSDPLQADADFDTLADGDEHAAGTDPHTANTDGDTRDDAEEVAVGTRPLVEDFTVTIGYRGLTTEGSCDPDDEPGEYEFDLGANTPDDTFLSAVTNTNLGLPICNGSPSDCNENFLPCECNDDGSWSDGLVKHEEFSTLDLEDRSVTFGVAVDERFGFAGSLSEVDSGGIDSDANYPYVLDDIFNYTLTLDGEGSSRSGFFNGDELEIGTLTGVFEKPPGSGSGNQCIVFLRVFMTVE